MVYDTNTIEEQSRSGLLTMEKMIGEEENDSNASEKMIEEEWNNSNESFSVSETGGEEEETGGVSSAGEENEKAEVESMDLS